MERQTRTVLLVEVHDVVRRAVARLLSAKGYEVATAASCSKALSQAGPFAVGIFDLSVGDGDGVALAADLLRQGRISRAIFYTGSAEPAQINAASEVGEVISNGDGTKKLLRALGQANGADRSSAPGQSAGKAAVPRQRDQRALRWALAAVVTTVIGVALGVVSRVGCPMITNGRTCQAMPFCAMGKPDGLHWGCGAEWPPRLRPSRW